MQWSADAIGQITALRTLAATRPASRDNAVRYFAGARRDIVSRHLYTLALLGEVVIDQAGRYRPAIGAVRTV